MMRLIAIRWGWRSSSRGIMHKFQSRELDGYSGRTYTFTFYEGLPEFRARVGGVYLVAGGEGEAGEEKDKHLSANECFLVGESEDLNRAISMLRGSRARLAWGRQLFGVLQVNDSGLRSAIQSDLLEAMEGPAWPARNTERDARGALAQRVG